MSLTSTLRFFDSKYMLFALSLTNLTNRTTCVGQSATLGKTHHEIFVSLLASEVRRKHGSTHRYLPFLPYRLADKSL